MKRFLALLLALVMVFSLTACGGTGDQQNIGNPENPGNSNTSAPEGPNDPVQPAADSGEPVYGGSATLYYSNFNQVFDPAMGEQYVYSLWLEYLWAPDWGLNDPSTFNFDIDTFTIASAAGQIADTWNWERNGDGTSDLYVTIRDDVYFQEKEAQYDIFGARNLTAADVAYSYDRLWGTGTCLGQKLVTIDADWKNRMSGLVNFDLDYPVEVLGDYELVFHLATESESRLSEFIIAQVNITGPEWDTLTDSQKNDWHYACGTGPYILTDFVAGSYYKYTRNENYYDYDERHPENKLPYLDTVTLTSIPDSAAIMSSFIAGNLDYISLSANLSTDQAGMLIDGVNGNIQVSSYVYGASGLSLKVNQEPFSDIRVRIAMQKAINLAEVNAAYYGYDTEMKLGAIWAPSLVSWCSYDEWDDALKDEYAYDSAAAKALLAEAGYPDGFTFTIAIDGQADSDLYQLIKSYLAEIGVNMEIQVLSDMMEGRQVQGDPNDPRQFNMGIANSSDAGFTYQTYATDGFAYCNYHEDKHMDELLAAARDALSLEEQAAAAKEADLYFAQNHWVIAMSGLTTQDEYLASRIGGLENGEMLSAAHFTKTFVARIWAKDGQ